MIHKKISHVVLMGVVVLLVGCVTTRAEHEDTHESAYITHVKKFTTRLQEKGFMTTGLVVAALAVEPVESIASGLRMNRGTRENFHAYHVNPTVLTKAQASKRPVLLLHGDKHNQSAFLPMLTYFYKQSYDGPIFTVNIPSVHDTKLRHHMIDKKIASIDALYKQQGVVPRPGEPHLRTLIIGHSWGADEAVELEDRDTTPRPLVLLGALKHSKRDTPQVYINAVTDVVLNLPFEIMDSIKPVGEIIHVDTGHLGLLSHPDSLKKCYEVVTKFTCF